MMNLIVVLVTSLFLAGTEANFRPCLLQYSDGTEKIIDCFPKNVFSCEQVNLTTSTENEGDENRPVAHEKASVIGKYVCKPRPCVEPSSVSENQTVVDCQNASAASVCVAAGNAIDRDALVELKDDKCARPVSAGRFEDLSKDPDIANRCTISPDVLLAQLACKVTSQDGTIYSERDCTKGNKECNAQPSCTVTINDEEVDLYFCDNQ